jgi:hypothetical protein
MFIAIECGRNHLRSPIRLFNQFPVGRTDVRTQTSERPDCVRLRSLATNRPPKSHTQSARGLIPGPSRGAGKSKNSVKTYKIVDWLFIELNSEANG